MLNGISKALLAGAAVLAIALVIVRPGDDRSVRPMPLSQHHSEMSGLEVADTEPQTFDSRTQIPPPSDVGTEILKAPGNGAAALPSIYGRVVDPSGAPLASARVRLIRRSADARWLAGSDDQVVSSDSEGQFSLEVDQGVRAVYGLLVQAAGFIEERRLFLRPGSIPPIKMYPSTAELAVTAVLEGGAPASGASCVVADGSILADVKELATGSWVASGLRAGQYEVVVRVPDHGEARAVAFVHGQGAQAIELLVRALPHRDVLLVDALSDVAIEGVSIRDARGSLMAVTDGEGRASLPMSGVAQVVRSYLAEHPEYAKRAISLGLPGASDVFALDPRATHAVHVHVARGDALQSFELPFADFRQDAGGIANVVRGTWQPVAPGRFVVSASEFGGESGPVRVSFWGGQTVSKVSVAAAVQELDEATMLPPIELVPGQELQITIADELGVPLAGVLAVDRDRLLSLGAHDDALFPHQRVVGVSDSEGVLKVGFSLDQAPPSIYLYRPGFAAITLAPDVRGAYPLHIEMVRLPSIDIEGLVVPAVGEEGAVIEGGVVRMTSMWSGEPRFAAIDALGRFAIRDLPGGQYGVLAKFRVEGDARDEERAAPGIPLVVETTRDDLLLEEGAF